MISDISYYNGVLLVDKQEGISSYDVIRRIKPQFPRKHKIGHAGTLDPFASGLLVVLIGRATKLSDRFMNLEKEYKFIIEFGYETDTQDIEGKKIAQDSKVIPKDQLQSTLDGFVGKYLQTPPQYSAKKIKGRSAYKYAREGKKVELEAKEVDIKEIELIDYNWPIITIRSVVASGTYIRKLVVDIAHSNDTVANTVELRRTRIGNLVVDNAIRSDNIDQNTIMDNLNVDLNG